MACNSCSRVEKKLQQQELLIVAGNDDYDVVDTTIHTHTSCSFDILYVSNWYLVSIRNK